MVGFDVTYDGARAPGAFSHHYRWKPVIVHGDQRRMPEGAWFTRYLPGVRLMDAGTKNKGGAGRSLTTPGGLEDGEDYPCRRRQRYAALLGEGAAECRLRRDLLRQRALGLSTAAGRAVRASAHRHRHAGDGWDRIGAPRLRARSRHQDHVHHWLCGRGAQFRFRRAEKCQGALQAGASARARQRGAQDARRLTRVAVLASSRWSRYDGSGPGRVAQRKSPTLTWEGSQVRSLSRPPSIP